MRADNVIVSALGLVGLALALVSVVRWRSLPIRSTPSAPDATPASVRARADVAIHDVGAILLGGVVGGLLVAGLVGRLVMRITAATSSDAQGLLTEAEEQVGEITLGGTIGFIIFVGLFGGVAAAIVLLIARSWLPPGAGAAGVVLGIVLTGLIGPLDPLAPDNVDFEILAPRLLAVVLVVATGVLLGLTVVATVSRLLLVAHGPTWRRHLVLLGLLAFPPMSVAGGLAYVVGRTASAGTVGAVLARPPVAIVGRIAVSLLVVAALLRGGWAVTEILRA